MRLHYTQFINPVEMRKRTHPTVPRGVSFRGIRFASWVLIFAALALFAYSLAWNFSTRRYLKGFADAIIPLDGSPEEKTEALVEWFHHEPQRIDSLCLGVRRATEQPRPCAHRPKRTLAEDLWIVK